MTRYEALTYVRAAFRSEQEMADAFGVTQPTIWRWLNQSKRIPPKHVLLAEELTKVSRHVLCPDMYPLVSAPGTAFIGVDRGTQNVAFNSVDVLQRSATERAA